MVSGTASGEHLRLKVAAVLANYKARLNMPAPARRILSTDHHHLVRALKKAGVSAVPCHIVSDMSHASASAFWAYMQGASVQHLPKQATKGVAFLAHQMPQLLTKHVNTLTVRSPVPRCITTMS